MAWIKRNLFFVIGGAVALALMGLAGWFLYSKWQLNNEILDKLKADYAELDRLAKQKPHPGSGQVDNIKIAKEQQVQLRDYLKKTGSYFERIPPNPNLPKLTDRDFSAALSRTIDQLQHDAANASVTLPPSGYNFSFEAEKRKVSFAAGSLEPLSVQLGEVKVICDVLCQAKVNALDAIRRERVSADDALGPQTDYIPDRSTTNDLAVLSPYELTFRGFSSEVAAVLAGFANSPHGLVVKTLSVEPASAAGTEAAAPGGPNPYSQPQGYPGVREPGGDEFPGGRRYPLPATPNPAPAAGGAAPPAAGRGGLPTVLDEKLLKITLALDVVKLLPPK